MSASPPPGDLNGVPKKPKTNPLRPMRKRPRANPLVSQSRRPAIKLGRPSSNPSAPTAPSHSSQTDAHRLSLENRRKQYDGWSEPPPSDMKYTDIPIYTSKKALLAGVKYHLMKFYQSKLDDAPVDPTNQDQFARPVTLQRRDPRQPPPGRAVKVEEPEPPQVDDAEKERLAQIKADREAQRAIDQAKIAPVIKENVPKRSKKRKDDKTVFRRVPHSEVAFEEAENKYQETLPWHLEDADGKNVWVGKHEAALSESNVAFLINGDHFQMIPLDKWYKFTAKPSFQAFTIDQAESLMSKKMDVGRWVMKDEERKAGRNDLEATRRLLYGRGPMVKTESDTFRAASRLEKQDHDELDVSGDEFQDDDEAPLFERNDDEETKDSKERIRREQLGANLFGEGDEQEVDKELHEQLKEEEERKAYGKTTKRALIKRDREAIYESDKSSDKPWSSSSDDDSSTDEEDNKDEDKKDGDVKGSQGAPGTKEKGKATGSQGNTTPQGKQKQGELGRKGKSLKRAGSPALSESSGNESSRKKMKKTGTPARGSRAGTPMAHGAASRKSRIGAGSGSDGEGTAGEMSDGAGPRKKIKLVGSNRGTPTASRAGSPNPPQGGGSPTSQGGSSVIESWEILEKIPADGITIGNLIQLFQGRVGDRPGQMPKQEWINLVKQLCDYGQDKRLRRRK